MPLKLFKPPGIELEPVGAYVFAIFSLYLLTVQKAGAGRSGLASVVSRHRS